MSRYKVAVLVGSIREGSLNRKVARAICRTSPDSLDCRMVEIADLPLYDPDLERDPPASWQRFRSAIADSDAVLFVTPEYNRSIPGALKNALDIGSRPSGKSVWARRPAGIVTASPGAIGGFGANHHLRQICVPLDMPMMQQPETYLGGVTGKKFADDGSISDDGLKAVIDKFADAFSGWVDLITKGRDRIACDPTGSDGDRKPEKVQA